MGALERRVARNFTNKCFANARLPACTGIALYQEAAIPERGVALAPWTEVASAVVIQ